jgi:phosphohistidine phosphatase SixA
MRPTITSILLLASLLFGCAAPAGPVAATTVICLRHAETGGGGSDPALSEEGRGRAERLATMLGAPGVVTHLFASEYRRTAETLEPLAARSGLEVGRHPASDVDGLAQRLRSLPSGSVAVVAGHSNTVPRLVRTLGGELDRTEQSERHGELLAHDDHSRVFVLWLDLAGAISTLELTVGPRPSDAAHTSTAPGT